MENLYPLPSLKKLKGKHKVDSIMPFGADVWIGELDDGELHLIIGCYKNTIKIKMGETEYDCMYKNKVQDIMKVNNIYAGLSYLTVPIGDCEIKLVLNMLEWEYKDEDIWC